MTFEKLFNESLKKDQNNLDLTNLKTITESDLNKLLVKIDTFTSISEIKINKSIRLNPKCKLIMTNIEQKLIERRQPTDHIYNLLAHHTYHFNNKCIIRNSNETIKSNRTYLFNCCNNNKIEIEQEQSSEQSMTSNNNLPKLLINNGWSIFEIFNEKGYLSIIYINEKQKHLLLSFQGIKLNESDFLNDLSFVHSILTKRTIQITYAYLHMQRVIEIANEKNYQLAFTGYSFGAYLAENCFKQQSINNNNLSSYKLISFKNFGSLDYASQLIVKLNEIQKKNNFDLKTLDVFDYLLASSTLNSKNE